MDAYWTEHVTGKRPDYLKKAEEKDTERFNKAKNKTVSPYLTKRPNKRKNEAFMKQGMTDKHIIKRYPHLPAKKYWGTNERCKAEKPAAK